MHFVRNYTQMNRRTMLKRAGAFGAASALGTLAAPAIRAGESRKITFANVETIAGATDILAAGAKQYNDLTGVEVEINTMSLDQVWINVQASLRSGKPIDIFMEGFIGHVALLAAQDAIVPLNQITDKYKWGPQILFPIDGQAFWMPYDYNFASLHYNKQTYADNNWNWHDVLLSREIVLRRFGAMCQASCRTASYYTTSIQAK